LRAEGHEVRVVREFPTGDGGELAAEAFAAEVVFSGGSLQFSPTPAMLLVDVDGTLDARALALAAIAPLAQALRRFDCGGSIGIDFPTLADKADRRAVDEALAAALAGWPHERTAMNGFGFVQLVARLERPSLLHRAAFQRAGMAARKLLRQAEFLEGAGAILLSGHPALEPSSNPSGSPSSPAAPAATCAGKRARPCHRGPAGPTRAAMSHPPLPDLQEAPRRAIRPVLLGRCRDRDLARWFNEGYAVPGPPADPEDLARED
jgi:endogenous inhibitor of DNA gyrase (YacG/DUF329 family)